MAKKSEGQGSDPFGPGNTVHKHGLGIVPSGSHLEHSMSRRGNCHDNVVAESFLNLLKRERVRWRTYKTREDTRRDVFDYIEMFYNPKRKHVRNGMLSPVEFERRQKMKAEGVRKTRGYSKPQGTHGSFQRCLGLGVDNKKNGPFSSCCICQINQGRIVRRRIVFGREIRNYPDDLRATFSQISENRHLLLSVTKVSIAFQVDTLRMNRYFRCKKSL